jgi:glycerophosphoryl diester phosphodiesterase
VIGRRPLWLLVLACVFVIILLVGVSVGCSPPKSLRWVAASVPLTAQNPPPPLIYGHRGARVPGITENTMPAFEYALRNGADGVEADLHVSKDGYVVLFHDQLLENRPISSYSYKELARKGVQRWWPVLKWARAHNLRGSWELKQRVWTDRQVSHVCDMVIAEGMDSSSTMLTHQKASLAQLNRLCPSLRTGWIGLKELLTPEAAANLAPVYSPSVARLRQEDAASYRAAGLDLHLWTIKTREHYLKARAAGASVVICDDVRACKGWASS